LRIRCSNNIRVGEHFGNFYQRSLTDLEFGTIGDSAAIGAVLKYEGKLDERELSYTQVAVLYTSGNGDRRVRVLNMSMGTTGIIGNVFRFADLDAAVTLYAKEGESLFFRKQLM
jgi:protein transport protein SEC24